MKFETVAATLSLIATIPLYKGWFKSSLQWNKERKIKSLKKQIQHYELLKHDNHYLIRWAAESVLMVLAILSAAFMFEGVAIDPIGETLSSSFIGLSATAAYITAIFKGGQLRGLVKYEETVSKIQSKIRELQG